MKKKISTLMLALTMVLALGATSAFATSTTTEFTCNSAFLYGGTGSFATNEDYANIYVSTSMPYNNESYMTYTLQVYSNGAYGSVGTPTYAGLASYAWGEHEYANGTITNVANGLGRSIRVRVDFYTNSNYTGHIQTAYTKAWVR